DVRRRFATADPAAKAPAIRSLVAREVTGAPLASMDELVGRYVALFGQLEKRWKERETRSAAKSAAAAPEPEWDALRAALFGVGGPLALSSESTRSFLDQTQRGQLDRLNGAIEAHNATHPGAPSRAMVLNDASQLYDPHIFVRGNPGRP